MRCFHIFSIFPSQSCQDVILISGFDVLNLIGWITQSAAGWIRSATPRATKHRAQREVGQQHGRVGWPNGDILLELSEVRTVALTVSSSRDDHDLLALKQPRWLGDRAFQRFQARKKLTVHHFHHFHRFHHSTPGWSGNAGYPRRILQASIQ